MAPRLGHVTTHFVPRELPCASHIHTINGSLHSSITCCVSYAFTWHIIEWKILAPSGGSPLWNIPTNCSQVLTYELRPSTRIVCRTHLNLAAACWAPR